jgi:hypothetical protein
VSLALAAKNVRAINRNTSVAINSIINICYQSRLLHHPIFDLSDVAKKISPQLDLDCRSSSQEGPSQQAESFRLAASSGVLLISMGAAVDLCKQRLEELVVLLSIYGDALAEVG